MTPTSEQTAEERARLRSNDLRQTITYSSTFPLEAFGKAEAVIDDLCLEVEALRLTNQSLEEMLEASLEEDRIIREVHSASITQRNERIKELEAEVERMKKEFGQK